MLQVWIDDSGTDQPPAFVLAGYIGRVKNWKGFSNDWKNLLNKSPKLEYVKGEQAFHRRKQFKDWTIEQRDKRVLEFCSLIYKYRLRPVKAVVRFDDFDAVNPWSRGPFKRPDYYALAEILIRVLSQIRLLKQREKLEFFFDEDVVSKQELKDAYETLMRILPRPDAELIENEPSFRNDKTYMPLQAADLLAWHVRRDIFDRERNQEFQSPIWKNLRRDKILDCSWNRQEMRELNQRAMSNIIKRLSSEKNRS